MSESFFEYSAGPMQCEGFVARPLLNQFAPAVMVCHAWAGQDEFARKKARHLATIGYVGVAIDVYGKGNRGTTKEECAALMTPLTTDRALLRTRLLASVAAVREIEGVNPNALAAIGFCFGGLCALDLARANTQGVKGVVSFHGLFSPPNCGAQPSINARVLALHGWDDPMATPDQVVGFAAEMTAAHANWEIDGYGRTMHAFTNPEANDPSFGTVYDAQADQRSDARMIHFLREIFAD